METDELSSLRLKATKFFVPFLLLQPLLIVCAGIFLGNSWIFESIISLCIVLVPVLYGYTIGIKTAGDNVLFRQLVAVSLIAMISMLVYVSRGGWQIDMHMYYFASFALLAFFCDPLVILTSAGITAVHHLFFNFFISYAVFPEASFARVLLHAVIVIVECSTLYVIVVSLRKLIEKNDLSREMLEKVKKEEELKAEKLALEEQHKTEQLAIVKEIEVILKQIAELDFSQKINLTDKSGFVLSLGNGINEMTESINIALNDISQAMKQVANGDLSAKINGEYKGTFAELKQDVNKTLDSIKKVVNSISEVSDSIGWGVEEITQSNDRLTYSLDNQLSKIQKVSESMDRISEIVKENSNNAVNLKGLADNSQKIATNANQIVADAVEKLKNISNSSEEITAITDVIDEIAFQTNLLALNASVEAARAGDAGRGFSVVANEVKTLAELSGNSSKKIKSLLTSSNVEVSGGVTSVNNTGKAIDEILNVIQSLNSSIKLISDASLEESNSLVPINYSIKEIEQLNEENKNIIESNAKTIGMFNDLTKKLGETMRWFK